MEIRVEHVLTVTAIGHPIVNDKLENNLERIIAMEGQILTVARHNLAVALETFLH